MIRRIVQERMDDVDEGGVHQHVEISIVVPIYNEADVIPEFYRAIVPVLSAVTDSYEIICVSDGSTDGTMEALKRLHKENANIKIIELSRNFGKELALTAGLDYAGGDAVIPIDVDLQDPPEVITQLVEKWREGFEVVLAARSHRMEDSGFKRLSADIFYKLINLISEIPIPQNVGDFRLLDRRVVDALGFLPERNRFMKGLFAWLGFRQTTVYYSRPARVTGRSKWGFGSLWKLAVDGVVSFTTLPLKIWSYLGFGCALLASLYLGFVVLRTLFYGVGVPGYASLLSVMLFFNGLMLMGLGIIGEYIARIFVEVKARPLYLIREKVGFDRNHGR
jgi:glycosyltransferase involved in cell wall biosynthesis